jgi:hypothetical protein
MPPDSTKRQSHQRLVDLEVEKQEISPRKKEGGEEEGRRRMTNSKAAVARRNVPDQDDETPTQGVEIVHCPPRKERLCFCITF